MHRGWVVALAICLLWGVLGVGCKGGGAGSGSGGKGATDGSTGDGASGSKDGSASEHPPVCNTTSRKGNTSLGQSCSCNTDCASGFCADGVCCNSACGDTCHSCNLPGNEGMCELIPAGVKPRTASECPAEADSSCGRDGTCDGKGGCRSHVRGTMCFPGTCDGDGIAGMKICDGKGSCGPGPAVSCAPYACANDKCPSACTTDGDCSAGHQCVNKSCGTLPNGRACKGNDDCSSSNCIDGVCCNVPCDGECVSCNQPDAVGQCRPLGQGQADDKCPAQNKSTCGTTGLCDGFGACALFPANAACIPPSCTGSIENTAGTCDGLGTCRQPGQVECSPFACQSGSCVKECSSDADCVAPNSCNNGSCGKKPMGSPCTGGSQCESNQCVDGVCCDSACTGACQSCSLQSSLGRCTNVGAGASDPHGQCKDEGAASCGTNGKCDGNGACRKYPVATVCGPETCSGGAYTPPSTCNASGQCIPPAGMTCFPYACNGSKCFTACTQTAGQCGGTNSCVNGSCGLKPPGAACSAGIECQPAPDGKQYCSQGVCCNSPCNTACQACNLSASMGTCTAVSGVVVDPQGKCANTPQASCGTNGKCRAGVCDVYQTTDQCAPVGCASPTTQYLAAFCSGKNTGCPGRVTISCGVNTCDSTTGTCRTSCRNNADCVSPNTCINNSCGLKSNGTACTADGECGSGHCTEGVCCNTDCSKSTTGVCQSCKVNGSVGTCKPVPLGGSDPQSRCLATARTSCGLDGACDGTGKCHFWDTTVGCRTQSCTGAVQTNTANCDGKGSCPAATTTNCDPFACNVAQATCRTTCTSSTDCNGVPCNTQTNNCGDKLAAGKTCGVDTDCASSFCVRNLPGDATGVCCNNACTGGCQSCSLATSKGTCTNIAANSPPRTATMCPASTNVCGNTGMCNGNGGCQVAPGGLTCGARSCPAGTTTFTNFGACDGAGACAPGPTTMCMAFRCDPTTMTCRTSCMGNADCDMANGYSCVTGVCQKLGPGVACTADNQCNTGACRDGVCCSASNTGCAGNSACYTCNGATPGTCTPVPAGMPDPHAATDGAMCAATAQSTCGNNGVCDGTGMCQKYPAATNCRPASCMNSKTQIAAASCPGGGAACPAMVATPCAAGFLCVGTACVTSCGADTDCDTAGGYSCVATQCVKKVANGQACNTANGPNSGSDCASGNCVSASTTGSAGICCATACPKDMSSTACGNTGACSAVTGTCAQAASGTMCGAAMCTGSVLTGARTCNGSGSCTAATTMDCAPYSCAPAGCNNPCNNGAKACLAGYTCSGGSCLADDGQACSVNGNCLNNHCAGGICCATACPAGNACVTTSCLASGAACAPAAAGVSCGNGMCNPDGVSGNSQQCDGSGACGLVPFTCTGTQTCAAGPPAVCM